MKKGDAVNQIPSRSLWLLSATTQGNDRVFAWRTGTIDAVGKNSIVAGGVGGIGERKQSFSLTFPEESMRIQLALIAIFSVVLSATAFGQSSQGSARRGVSAPPGDQGVRIQGNTEIQAKQENVTAIAGGQGNEARNTAGAIKGDTEIQGNTKIKASQKNMSADAFGKNNISVNEAGVVGGKGPGAAKRTKIQGNTQIAAKQADGMACASGEGNETRNSAGTIKGAQIQGNTKIDAAQKKICANASGKGNLSANASGQIGGQ